MRASSPLTRPPSQRLSKVTGFLPIERAWLDKLFTPPLAYVDALRHFHPDRAVFTYWDAKTGTPPPHLDFLMGGGRRKSAGERLAN
jgi:exonuclease III